MKVKELADTLRRIGRIGQALMPIITHKQLMNYWEREYGMLKYFYPQYWKDNKKENKK